MRRVTVPAIATVLVALSLTAGCSGGEDSPAAAPTTGRTTPAPTAAAPQVGPVEPGAIEPVKTGDTVFEYMRQGVLVADQHPPCDGNAWLWAGPASRGLHVGASPEGRITALGVDTRSAKTAEGVGVGDSYADLKSTYGRRLSALQGDDYDSGWVSVHRGNAWMSFMLGPIDQVVGTSRVRFVEVGRGKVLHSFGDAC